MAEQVLIPSLAAVPTVVDVVALQAVTEYPAVSVLMTTTPAERMPADDRDRLHGLVGDAVSRLRSAPRRPGPAVRRRAAVPGAGGR